jgi:hypothetical protein
MIVLTGNLVNSRAVACTQALDRDEDLLSLQGKIYGTARCCTKVPTSVRGDTDYRLAYYHIAEAPKKDIYDFVGNLIMPAVCSLVRSLGGCHCLFVWC